jgi:ABC-type multidrug transport system ATPase subunit
MDDSKAFFLICPKCNSAFSGEKPQVTYTCKQCGHNWQAPRDYLNGVYFANITEVQTYLVGRGESFLLKEFPAILGRDSEFRLLQQNLSVSRKHFSIDFDAKQECYIITPFKTGGGTYLNGKLLTPEQPYTITTEDELVVSGVVLKLKTIFKEQLPIKEVSPSLSSHELKISPQSDFVFLIENPDKKIIETTSTYSNKAIAALVFNHDISKWRIFSINHNSITINGNAFIDKTLEGGESFNIAGHCYIFNDSNSCFEVGTQDKGVELVAEKLSAGYGSKIVINNLNFAIPKGKLTAILGQSGCGKTTLIKVLSGQKLPSKGSIKIDSINKINYAEWIKMHLAFVPQHDVVHPELTVMQCLDYAAELRVGDKSKIQKSLVAKILRDTGLDDYSNQKISDLSGGQRKRVNIAVELLGHPDILLLDEPTTGLDYATEKQIIAELHQLSCQGKTVVFVTHSLSTIEIADHVIVLQKGNNGAYVVAEGSPNEVQEKIGVESWADLYAKIEQKSKSNESPKKDNKFVRGFRLPLIPTQLSRYISTWFASPFLSSLLLFGFPFLLGIIIRASVSIDAPIGKDRILFGLIAMFWLGINQSVREIVKEKNIFIQERSGHISSSGYLFSKIAFFTSIALPQAILMALPIMWFNFNRQAGELFLKSQLDYCTMGQIIPVFWFAAIMGTIVGLFISTVSMFFRKGEVASVLISVLITLPQILYSNKNMPRELIDAMKPEQYYNFILWHEEAPRLTEILSFFTFSRYLYVPLDAVVTQQSTNVIRNAMIFNFGILAMVAIVITILSWLLLEMFTVWVYRKH